MNNRFFKIEISGWGGELVLGDITHNQYKYWIKKEKEQQGSLTNYLSNYEFDSEKLNKEIPVEARFNKSWFEIDNILHTAGAEITEDNSLKIIETTESGVEINNEEISFDLELFHKRFKTNIEVYNEKSKLIKNKFFFYGQTFEEGYWDTFESGHGLIQTSKKGLDYNNLIFYIREILDRPICYAISYDKTKYDMIGNTQTNNSQMSIHKN